MPLPLALTMGDPAGIGPDLILDLWEQRGLLRSHFCAIGDVRVFETRARHLGKLLPIVSISDPEEASCVFEGGLPVLPCGVSSGHVSPGVPSLEAVPSILASLESAVSLALDGKVSALVTLPIAKYVLYKTDFPYQGHTDYLAALCHRASYAATPVMMLEACGLRTVPLTVHIPLSQVPKALFIENIVAQAQVVAHDLVCFLKIPTPRLAVAGLNPHAGEEGTIGLEEQEIILPAIERMKTLGLIASGPHSADSLFHSEMRHTYDVALCMYHDQALIPVKMLGFFEGVNITLGLPFVRTSPDHGTAFSLAGTGKASSQSLLAAVKWAENASLQETTVS